MEVVNLRAIEQALDKLASFKDVQFNSIDEIHGMLIATKPVVAAVRPLLAAVRATRAAASKLVAELYVHPNRLDRELSKAERAYRELIATLSNVTD